MARLGSGTTTDTTSTSNEFYYAGEAFRLAYDVGEGTGSRRTQTDFLGYTITAKALAVEVTNNDPTTAVPLGVCTIDPLDTSLDTLTTKVGCDGTWVQNSAIDLIPDGVLDPSTTDGSCSFLRGTCVLPGGSTILETTKELCDLQTDGVFNLTYPTEIACETGLIATQEGSCTIGSNIENSLTVQECFEARGTADVLERNESGVVTETVAETELRHWTSYIWTPNNVKAEGKFYIYIPKDILNQVGFMEAPVPGSPLYIAYSVDYTESPDISDGDIETRVIETDIIGFKWTPMFDIDVVA